MDSFFVQDFEYEEKEALTNRLTSMLRVSNIEVHDIYISNETLFVKIDSKNGYRISLVFDIRKKLDDIVDVISKTLQSEDFPDIDRL
jgi:hypothetical protein